MEYLIWYNTETKSCYIGQKCQYELLVETFTDESLMVVEERKITNKAEYRKALKVLVKLRKSFRHFGSVAQAA